MIEGQIISLIILLFLSAFFSGVETALMSLNMIKVNTLVRQKKPGAETLHRIKQNPHKLLITILIGNNLVNISAAAIATVLFTNLFGSAGVGIATGVMTFFILIFGEITPKTYAFQNAKKISLKVARPIEILSTILSPFIFLFEGISRFMSMILGTKEKKQLSEEELQSVVTMGVKEGLLNREAARMMRNIIVFEGTKVTKIMTPKVKVVMLNEKAKVKDVLNTVVKSKFSKFPIYKKTKDNITGVIEIDDILKYIKNKKLNTHIKRLAEKAYFVPKAKEIDDLLFEFEGKKIQLAIVVDEYGEVAGIVTVQDILEEIVGDIFDKSNRNKLHIKKINERLTRVDAQASIEEVNKVLNLGVKKEQFDTIGGFMEHKLKKIPKKGEQIELDKIMLEVHKTSKQKIKSINVIKK